MTNSTDSPDAYKLTEEDLSLIRYFILNKGDVTRWVDWYAKRDLVKQKFPYVIEALENLEKAETALTAALNQMVNHGPL